MSTIREIMSQEDIDLFVTTGEINQVVWEKLFDMFVNTNEMPYGTAKARDGDPYQWIENRLAEEFGQL